MLGPTDTITEFPVPRPRTYPSDGMFTWEGPRIHTHSKPESRKRGKSKYTRKKGKRK